MGNYTPHTPAERVESQRTRTQWTHLTDREFVRILPSTPYSPDLLAEVLDRLERLTR